MKRIHILLILVITAITAMLLWQGHRIRDRETALREELARHPKSHVQEAADLSSRTMKGSRPEGQRLDQERFISGLKENLTANDVYDPKQIERLFNYLDGNRKLIATHSRETNAEICEIITASGVGGGTNALTRFFLGLVADTDPAWAIPRMDQIMSAEGSESQMEKILIEIGRRGVLGSSNLCPEYALVFEKWLDTAQSAGRLKGMDRDVAAARFDISMAMGDLAGATLHFSQMTPGHQSRVIPEIANAAKTPDERRELIQLVSKSAAIPVFLQLVQTVAAQSGFEGARDILAAAELTPQNRDLAAAAIAGANINQETPTRAAWLLDTLQLNNKEPVTHFTASWAQGDYKGTVGWLNSLPQGETRAAAVAGFAPVAARIDGASAVDWALTLTDSAQREATLTTVYQTWKKQEPEAAAAYLKDKGIDIKP